MNPNSLYIARLAYESTQLSTALRLIISQGVLLRRPLEPVSFLDDRPRVTRTRHAMKERKQRRRFDGSAEGAIQMTFDSLQ